MCYDQAYVEYRDNPTASFKELATLIYVRCGLTRRESSRIPTVALVYVSCLIILYEDFTDLEANGLCSLPMPHSLK